MVQDPRSEGMEELEPESTDHSSPSLSSAGVHRRERRLWWAVWGSGKAGCLSRVIGAESQKVEEKESRNLLPPPFPFSAPPLRNQNPLRHSVRTSLPSLGILRWRNEERQRLSSRGDRVDGRIPGKFKNPLQSGGERSRRKSQKANFFFPPTKGEEEEEESGHIVFEVLFFSFIMIPLQEGLDHWRACDRHVPVPLPLRSVIMSR